jgi:hypothetical protein
MNYFKTIKILKVAVIFIFVLVSAYQFISPNKAQAVSDHLNNPYIECKLGAGGINWYESKTNTMMYDTECVLGDIGVCMNFNGILGWYRKDFSLIRADNCIPDLVCKKGTGGIGYYDTRTNELVRHVSQCPMGDCLDDKMCGENQFCMFSSCDDKVGQCTVIPKECPYVYDPVCGCDGIIYNNKCEMKLNKMSPQNKKACLMEDGDKLVTVASYSNVCYNGQMCASDEYCKFSDCFLGSGICTPIPQVCNEVYMPVCGCDGKTYTNECYLEMNRVSKDHDGQCKEKTYCYYRGDTRCPKSQYCKFNHCHEEVGICTNYPQECPTVFEPVCGCDGVTYFNECIMALAGMSKDYDGECKEEKVEEDETMGAVKIDEPQFCSYNNDCGENEFCEFPNCLAETGVCTMVPDVCPLVYEPVCGCDGNTYNNECEMRMKKVSKDHDGPCKEKVSCFNNEMCKNDQYCYFDQCAAETGYCIDIPEVCSFLYDPVCGCDGKTYVNECEMRMKKVSKDHDGPCAKKPPQLLFGLPKKQQKPVKYDDQLASILDTVETIVNRKFDALMDKLDRQKNLALENMAIDKYLDDVLVKLQGLKTELYNFVVGFVAYGVDETTSLLGMGERAAVVKSFEDVYNRLPQSNLDVLDLIKIAEGRYPDQRNLKAEKKAIDNFIEIYKRVPDIKDDVSDKNAIMIMTYGIRQMVKNRNLKAEVKAIEIYKEIFKKHPKTIQEWNIIQAIAYSGCTRKPDTDKDLLADEYEIKKGTDMNNSDTDNDGIKDGEEIIIGSNPLK